MYHPWSSLTDGGLYDDLAMAGEPGKRHDDWLNPLSLGTMSASAYIENLA